jgi:hypothetical protein
MKDLSRWDGSRRSLEEMEGLVRECERSGMTQKEFVLRRGINISTLQYWRRRVKAAQKPHFVEVQALPAMDGARAARIELPGNVVIHWEGALPVEALVQLSRALS